ncbi:family 76 glycoside hydrolase [Melampsora americana]|nr:family 76 glycoside hydrolase [Melampsora americana]
MMMMIFVQSFKFIFFTFLSISFTFVLQSSSSVSASSSSPKINLNHPLELKNATIISIRNLLKFYSPNPTGVFDQVQIPWWTSAVIWGSLFNYATWVEDDQFTNLATEALTNMSYGEEHDFLGGKLINSTEKLSGKWNDDILWASQVILTGAKLLGPNSIMGNSNKTWISLVTKTIDQTYIQTDEKCGGGIYWYRDRNSSTRGSYKAVITQLEFISQGATIYLLTKNETILSQSKAILDWVLTSGISNPETGLLLDGVSTTNCSDYTESLWSYSYGQLIGALAWMHKATKSEKYLEMAIPFLDFAIKTFTESESELESESNSNRVITELCEKDDQTSSCQRDQTSFKSILTLNLVYLYKFTNQTKVKEKIKNLMTNSLKAMIKNSCDSNWNCDSNWRISLKKNHHHQNLRKINLASQQVSTALLISMLGIQFHDTHHHHHHHHITNL